MFFRNPMLPAGFSSAIHCPPRQAEGAFTRWIFPQRPWSERYVEDPLKSRVMFMFPACIGDPVKLWEGGLDGVNAGLDYMREGKNSGEKLVYRISA